MTTLRDLAEKATPGPWTTDGYHVFGADMIRAALASMRDAAYIAAASPDRITALIEAGERVVEGAYHWRDCPKSRSNDPCDCGLDETLAAWRKACEVER